MKNRSNMPNTRNMSREVRRLEKASGNFERRLVMRLE